jgi:yecA family protein
MEQHIPLSGPIDLDALDDYLLSDHAPGDSMGLSDLDGFLTGIVVGPELILPSEWLPVIWGGEEPEFETETEMRGRYNEIVGCLDSEPENFEPILMEGTRRRGDRLRLGSRFPRCSCTTSEGMGAADHA